MAASEARTRANRENALRSTGPKTEEGKARSRRNSLKHGLTGAGVVLPDEDQAEVDRRFAALEAELAPSSELAGILVERAAILSVRMKRCVREEAARLGQKMRAAPGEFDDLRLAEAQKLFDWIAAEPATNARRLRRTPEGVDLLIGAWEDLAADLSGPNARRWDYTQWQRLENLQGRKPEDSPISRNGALSKALWGDQSHLKPEDGEGLEGIPRLEWVRDQLLDRIIEEIAELRALRDGLDHQSIARDRSESMTRAIFDGSREGVLARKYEAAAEGFASKLMSTGGVLGQGSRF